MEIRFRLRLEARAKQALRQLADGSRREISHAILDLAEDPFPPGSKPLNRELTGRYVVRHAGSRIIYKVDEQDRVVVVLDVRARDENTYLNVP